MSERTMSESRTSQQAWVTERLLPVLANYKRILRAEQTSLKTYQANVAASYPSHPSSPVSKLNYEERFGSWIRHAVPLSVVRRLRYLGKEMEVLQTSIALMTQYGYGLNPQPNHSSQFHLGVDGIKLVKV